MNIAISEKGREAPESCGCQMLVVFLENKKIIIRDHLFSRYTESSEKLIFLNP